MNAVKHPKKVCHYKVLKGCVARNKAFFTQLRDASIGIIRCPCSENCVDTNIFLDTFQELRGATDILGTIGGIVTIETYPLIRYKRKILFSLTDLLGFNVLEINFLLKIFNKYLIFSFHWRNGCIIFRFLCSWCY